MPFRAAIDCGIGRKSPAFIEVWRFRDPAPPGPYTQGMTQDEFDYAITQFDRSEKMRSALYYRAEKLIAAGFTVEAHLLILATWNFARFRYATRTFDLEGYGKTVEQLAKSLQALRGQELLKLTLAEHKQQIVEAFKTLAVIKGIEFTGAAKILHLMFPAVFVMWDRYISGQYSKKHYSTLDVVRSNDWSYHRFPSSGEGYFDFLLSCQQRFKSVVSKDGRKTVAKCIDEFNFVKITYPLMKEAQRKLLEKKRGKRDAS